MIKYFCDVCKKEVHSSVKLEKRSLVIPNTDYHILKTDICKDCAAKMDDLIIKVKYQFYQSGGEAINVEQ